MAETSEGSYKPSDFFVGIVDFFSILLPGALLVFLTIMLLSERASQYPMLEKALNELRGEHAGGWVAFAIASYILGHFIFIIGSFLLDKVYDNSYRLWFGSMVRRLNTATKEALNQRYEVGDADSGKSASTEKKRIDQIIRDDTLGLAEAFVRSRNPAGANEIDRCEADSKFFRSLTALQLLGWPLQFLAWGSFPRRTWVLYGLIVLCLLSYRLIDRLMQGGEEKAGAGASHVPAELEATSYRESSATDMRSPYTADLKSPLQRLHETVLRNRLPKRLCLRIFDGLSGLLVALLLTTGVSAWTTMQDRGALVICSLLFILSLWRFMERRLKRTKLTYEFFLVSAKASTLDLKPENKE